jgi:hypothetical protein
MIKRITKIVQSIFQLLSYGENLPSVPIDVSPFLLVNSLFGFRSGVNRAAAMTHKLLSFFDDSFGGLTRQLCLLTKAGERLEAARKDVGPHALTLFFDTLTMTPPASNA